MVDLAPFRGLRYADDIPLSEVTAPPYDAINDELAAELRRRHPHNVVRLERGAGTGRTGGSGTSGAGLDPYARVARTYRDWRDRGVLRRDPEPGLYVYEQAYVEDGEPRRQRGVFTALRLRPWGAGEVLPHERIYRPPVEDRLRLLRSVPANTSAVFGLAEREPDEVGRALDEVMRGPPSASFRDPDGVEHRMWLAAERSVHDAVASGYREVPLLMADGHHRYTTALEYRDDHPEVPAAARILTYVVGGDGPVIRPSHRIVQAEIGDVGGVLEGVGLHVRELASAQGPTAAAHGARRVLDPASAGLRGADRPAFVLLTRSADVSDGTSVVASLVSVADEPRARRLGSAADAGEDARDLDATLLHGALDEALGVDDGSDEVRLTSDAEEALRAVATGQASAAFLVRPVTVDQVRRVAEAGGRMPPKSTSFHPKPRTGLVIRPLHA